MSESLFHINMPWLEIRLAKNAKQMVKSIMSPKDLSRIIDQHQIGISVEDILGGKLDHYVNRGLRVISLCNDGSGRSQTVEKSLNDIGIPCIRLRGGIKQFSTRDGHEKLIYTAQVINSVPNVAVILTGQELTEFSGILQNLRALRYVDSTKAIESIRRIEQ